VKEGVARKKERKNMDIDVVLFLLYVNLPGQFVAIVIIITLITMLINK
jgi:hypothetical protein